MQGEQSKQDATRTKHTQKLNLQGCTWMYILMFSFVLLLSTS